MIGTPLARRHDLSPPWRPLAIHGSNEMMTGATATANGPIVCRCSKKCKLIRNIFGRLFLLRN